MLCVIEITLSINYEHFSCFNTLKEKVRFFVLKTNIIQGTGLQTEGRKEKWLPWGEGGEEAYK